MIEKALQNPKFVLPAQKVPAPRRLQVEEIRAEDVSEAPGEQQAPGKPAAQAGGRTACELDGLQPVASFAAQTQGDAATTQGKVRRVVINVVERLDMTPDRLLQQRVAQET